MRPVTTILLAVAAFSHALGDDYDKPGERAALKRLLGPLATTQISGEWHSFGFRPSDVVPKEPETNLVRIRRVNQKLDGIRIPKIDLQDKPLKEALRWLCEASTENDFQSANSIKGIIIVAKFEEADSKPHSNITLHLANATLREALAALSLSAKLNLKVLPDAVALSCE